MCHSSLRCRCKARAYILLAGPLPAIFGLNIATYILCELAGKPINNPLPIKGRKKFNERLYRDLHKREEKFLGHQIKCVPPLRSALRLLHPITD